MPLGAITGIVLLLIVLGLHRIGGPDFVFSTFVCLMADIGVVYFRWSQRRHPWFWAVLVFYSHFSFLWRLQSIGHITLRLGSCSLGSWPPTFSSHFA